MRMLPDIVKQALLIKPGESTKYDAEKREVTNRYRVTSELEEKFKVGKALSWFKKSFKTKQFNINYIKKDKLIGALHDGKRFETLMKKYY